MTEHHESLAERYARLASETPGRSRDGSLRALDVAFSLVFSLVALPFAAGVAVAILVTTGRPVLYSGERVGRAGRTFTMHKFRTLSPDAESRLGGYLGPELVERTRAEVTKLGRWLRATQLDELPQFWNVLRGDMSFVGPRPIRPRFFEELAAELPAYWQRLVVRPGLTGLRAGAARLRDVDGRRSSRTTSSGSPTARCGSTCARSGRPAGACCASPRAGVVHPTD